jgi:hypothetical protein
MHRTVVLENRTVAVNFSEADFTGIKIQLSGKAAHDWTCRYRQTLAELKLRVP